MKKLSILAAFAALAFGASAQNFAVTSHFAEGDLVDGQTIDCPYVMEYEYLPEDVGMYMAAYQWNPHFEARSLTGEAINITVTATSSIGAQLCWPAGCVPITPNASVNASGSISTEGSDLMFDAPAGEVYGESKPTEPFVCNPGGTGSITIKSGGQTMTLYVNWLEQLYGEAAVGSIEAEDMAPRYYTLQGVEVANPERGLYIVKRGNKVSKQIFK